MESQAAPATQDVRYEPNEPPPPVLSLGISLQYAMLAVSGIVLTPVIMIRAAGGGEAYLSWAVFAALAISGVTTVLQAARVGRIGSGYILLMGSSGAFLAICISALEQGGPGLLASLIVTSSLFQFALAAKLSLFRRVFTPTVAGTVLMLIPVTLGSIVFGRLTDVPAGAPPAAAPVCAGVTLIIIVAIALRASGTWRLWAPAIGLVVGSAIGGLAFGIYDTAGIREARWIGLPVGTWPGFDFGLGPAFWALLPAFVLVTLIGALDTIGDSIAIQRVSWRRPRAIDFRAIQGAVAADGVGNLLSGLACTVPNTTYASSIAIAEITRVAARSVGVYVGIIFVALAFMPKFIAIIVAIPSPVVAAYLIVLVAVLFVLGMKILLHDGLDYRKSLIVGLSFWVGAGFQLEWIFPEYFTGAWSEVFGNGMTVGALVAMLMTGFLELTGPRRRRIRAELNVKSYPKIDAFLTEFAARRGWNTEMSDRLRAVGEETLLTLIRQEDERKADGGRRLLLVARSDGGAAELEFIAATDETNLEDQIALLGERAGGAPVEDEVSLRLLRHWASSVRHQQYHDTDVVTVRVEPSISL